MRRLLPLIAIVMTSACLPPGPVSPPAAQPSPTVTAALARPSCAEPGEGRYIEGSARVLLLGHGVRGVVVGAQANGGICQTIAYARELVAAGYHVAIFDWTSPYADAMTAATDALVADGATKVVVGGFSRGAVVGLGIAADLGNRIVGVFSVSGGPSETEGFPTIASVSRYRGPILIVASEQDRVFPQKVTAALVAAHRGPETVVMLKGASHALSILDGDDGPRVRAAIIAFLAARLP